MSKLKLKYSFKNLFSERVIHNEGWACNKYFIVKKSILTKGQLKILNQHKQEDKQIKDLLENVLYIASDLYNDTRKEELEEFIPDLIWDSRSDEYKAIYNNDLDITLREDFYNFFKDRKCTIYKGKGSYNPLSVIRNGEFVGIVLPIRLNLDKKQSILDNATKYQDYITELKAEQKRKAELRRLKKQNIIKGV